MPEGGVAGSAGAAGAGIRNAPVDGLRTARELGADFANFVAERHDVFEAAPGVLLQVLAAPVGDVDAVLAHHPDCVRVEVLGTAACAERLDPVAGGLREKSFGDLGAGAVPGAKEKHALPRSAARTVDNSRAGGETGVERHPGCGEKFATAGQLDPVVAVSTISRAAPHRYESTTAQTTEVIRNGVLRLADPRAQLPDSQVAARQLRKQPPAHRVRRQLQERRWG